MSNGQVSKMLREDDDCVHIVFYPYGDMMDIKDKLYASEKIAAKNRAGGHIIKISKKLLMQLHNEQNGGTE